MRKEIKNKIKVVFWDLDDTIWKGTLAEGDQIELISSRIDLIRTLNRRGIVNSICSKNDFETARKELENLKIWNLFVFPGISFAPKGEMIKAALSSMNLRADNALFIDDNDFNLREVLFYNPDISVMDAHICDSMLDENFLQGKDDSALSRYWQYKQLEKKMSAQKMFSSNEEFLKESEIRVEFIDYEEQYFERLYELSDRTNQLNFTKNRMTREQLAELVKDRGNITRLVHVMDNFGDYGIAGFYTLCGNKLKHFLFSCRIMNMGIEQWVYSRLDFPELEIFEGGGQYGRKAELSGFALLDTAL